MAHATHTQASHDVTTSRANTLKIEHLRVSVGSSPVSFTVAPAECLALLGSKSAALSELFDALAGFPRVAGGSVFVDNQNVTHTAVGHRSIGIVSTRDPLFAHLDVSSNISFGLRVQPIATSERLARLSKVTALLGLDGLDRNRVADLNAEYRLRVSLARVVACNPSILLLDDPLGGLSANEWRTMARVIARLQRALSLTIVVATTRRDEALLLGDKIGVMEDTKLLQIGTAPELLDRPADETVAMMFGDANCLTGVVDEIDNDIARIYLKGGGIVEALDGGGLRQDAVCIVCIRPDRIAPVFSSSRRAQADMASEEGMIPATLTDAAHLGDHVRLRFRLSDSTEVIVKRPPIQGMNGMDPGRPALLAWQPTHATAFPLRA